MLLKSCFVLSGLLAASVLGETFSPSAVTIAPAATSGLSAMVTNSAQGPFDGSKITHPNSTSFDWWYFEVVSSDHQQAFLVLFGVRTGNSYLDGVDNNNSVGIGGRFPNGTTFFRTIPAGDAVIQTQGQGSSGLFENTGCRWNGTADMRSYTVHLNTTEGIEGTMTFESVAPAHYPAHLWSDYNASEILSPGLGWANALPNARAVVDVNVNGTTQHFAGSGYHDKNWAVQTLLTTTITWYWGHASLGNLTLVWFYVLGADNEHHVSGYLAEGDEVLALGDDNLVVRPNGPNTHYPPQLDDSLPESLSIHITADNGTQYSFTANCEAIVPSGAMDAVNSNGTVQNPGYTRWIGEVVGGSEEGRNVTGTGLFEWQRALH